MAKLLRLRRGTDTQHTTFTGAEGEVTVNTTNDTLHVHDGSTAGGHELARADLSNVDNTTIVNGTSNVSVAASGDITVTRAGSNVGTFGASGLGFGDNVKATFGASNDLEIYHDGSQSFIHDSGTGSLIIKADEFFIQNAAGTENKGYFQSDGPVRLYYDSAQKLTTTSTGIDVTGTVTCDGMTCDGSALISAGSGILQIRDNNTTSNADSIVYIQGEKSDGSQRWRFGDVDSTGDIYITNASNSSTYFQTDNTNRAGINSTGFFPGANNTYDLGTSSFQWRDAYFDGTVNCDGLTCDGDAQIESSQGILTLKDNTSSGAENVNYVRGRDTNNLTRWYVGHASTANESVYVANAANASIIFETNAAGRALIDSSGHFIPWSNNTYDLGSSSQRWRNVYTNDLNLSNEGGANDVDGTWGSWTIQEGEDDLFLLNRRNGKKYKFNLSEVN